MGFDYYFIVVLVSFENLCKICVLFVGCELEVIIVGGVFSLDCLDVGIVVFFVNMFLVFLGGDFFDFGSGWGFISLVMVLVFFYVMVWVVDVNECVFDFV